MGDENQGLFKDQEDWFQKVSREVVGKPGAFLKDLTEQLQRDGAAAARERIDRLQAHREAVLKRVDAAIDAEKAIVERLSAKVAEISKGGASAKTAAPATKARKPTVAKKAAAPRKRAASTKPINVRTKSPARKGSKPR